MTFLLGVLYVLNIRWASGTDIDCFAELLPWIFGADDGDTKITAADDIFTPEATHSGWDFHAYLGGQTTDPRLVGETTSGPLS